MKIMLVGANGQLGTELQKNLDSGNDTWVAYNSTQLDITDRNEVLKRVMTVKPDVIIDAAAYTKVDLAEDEGKKINWAVNFTGTKNLADAAKKERVKLVYVSTDYVFDGTKHGEYSENDVRSPKNQYGEAKLAGEQYIQENLVDYYIVRTSWVYGEFGKNFYFTMKRLAQQRKEISVVNDQFGQPTWTKTLADFILYLLDNDVLFGIYNLSNEGRTTWFDFAKEILKEDEVQVLPVDSSSFPQKALRPEESVLSLNKAKGTGFEIPTWQEALRQFKVTVSK
ncbi:dTDP-4-dehydrorhamnose reductase [Furfurilactobacillus sp. WILCCON 0119]